MPLDPNIALGVKPPAAPSNPMELLGGIAETQKKLTEARFMQAKFKAQQQAGAILAQAPTLAEGMAALSKSPEIAMFPEILNSVSEFQNTQQDWQGKVYSQRKGAMTDFMSELPGMIADHKYGKVAAANVMNNISDQGIKISVEKSLANMNAYINDDTSDDPAIAKQQRNQRLTSALVGSGGIEIANKLHGAPVDVDVKTGIQPGIRRPSFPTELGGTPGAIEKTGAEVPFGIGPQLATPEATAFPGQRPGGNALSPGGGSPAAAGNSLALPKPKAVGGASAPEAAPVPSAPVTGLGKPLFDSKTDMSPPKTFNRNLAGNPTGEEGRKVANLGEAFVKEEKHIYDNANVTKAQFREMDYDIEKLAKGGGFLSPGAAADFRVGLVKAVKLFGDVTGTDMGVDTEKVASAESLAKTTNQMVLRYLNTALGTQREAAETIRNFTDKGVPGINNTYLGAKTLIKMMGAINDRAVDLYNWKTEWSSRNNGDLRNAEQAFNKKFPATEYIDKALSDLGLDREKGGFKSVEDVNRAYQEHLITKEQAEFIKANKGKMPADMPKTEPEVGK